MVSFPYDAVGGLEQVVDALGDLLDTVQVAAVLLGLWGKGLQDLMS